MRLKLFNLTSLNVKASEMHIYGPISIDEARVISRFQVRMFTYYSPLMDTRWEGQTSENHSETN